MEIAELIYGGVVEPSYFKITAREDANRASHIRLKRLESASSQTHSVMGESTNKRIKWYVDLLSGEFKICIIHGPGHSSDECKVLGDFGAK